MRTPFPVRVALLRSWVMVGTLGLLLAACQGENPETLLAQAQDRLAAGDAKAAVIHFKNLLAVDAGHVQARRQLGELYLSLDNPAAAEKELRLARQYGAPPAQIDQLIAISVLQQRDFQRLLDAPQARAATAAPPDGLVAQALAHLGLGQIDEARNTLERARTLDSSVPGLDLAFARLALAEGNTARALADIDLALGKQPRSNEAWLMRGDVLRLRGDPQGAATAYATVRKIDPIHLGARLALASLALERNEAKHARQLIKGVLRDAPSHLQGRYLAALLDYREGKHEDARDWLAGVLKTAPDNRAALLLGANVEYRLGNFQTAATYLNKLAQSGKIEPQTVRLLAATQLRLGRPETAERTLRPLLDAPEDAATLALAGEIALQLGKTAQASNHFEAASRIQPDSAALRTSLGMSRLAQGAPQGLEDLREAAELDPTAGADLLLILAQIRAGQFDAALGSLAAMERKTGKTAQSWNARAAAQLGKQDRQTARASLKTALKIDPAYFPAAANLARLDMLDGAPDRARRRFERVLSHSPRNTEAMLALAGIAYATRDDTAQLAWLNKAVAADPKAIRPRLALGEFFLAAGENNRALTLASELRQAHPDSRDALHLLSSAQLATGDAINAAAGFRKLVNLAPAHPLPRIRLAQALILGKNDPAALASLRESLRLYPASIDARKLVAEIHLRAGQYDAALRQAREIRARAPDSALGHVLTGDIARARRDWQAALTAYGEAYRMAPDRGLLLRMHGLFERTGKSDASRQHLANWLQSHPADSAVRLILADSLLKDKHYDDAIRHYGLVLKQDPAHLVALNNTAWALFNQGKPGALKYAEKAVRLHPDRAEAIDTHGWLLLQQGQIAQAVNQLKLAHAKSPDNPTIHYHLAEALQRSGDHARARGELERLFATGQGFPEEDAARRLYTRLHQP